MEGVRLLTLAVLVRPRKADVRGEERFEVNPPGEKHPAAELPPDLQKNRLTESREDESFGNALGDRRD